VTMKKLFLGAMIFTFLFMVGTAFAQYDPKALEILDAMSKKYKSIPAFEANFSYVLTNETDKINEEFKGKMVVKGEKFRLVLPEQEVINNGVTVWTYLPEAKEVNIDNADPANDEVNPSKFYDIYHKGYKYLYLGEKTESNVPCDMVDLVPEKKDAQIFKITMVIAKKDRSVHNFTIFERTGNRFKYTITKFTPNAKIEDNYFTFDPKKYPGVEVVELRN
jgi:outer membrane lipoprotein carrier protein